MYPLGLIADELKYFCVDRDPALRDVRFYRLKNGQATRRALSQSNTTAELFKSLQYRSASEPQKRIQPHKQSFLP